jgi:hypothetical protein
MKKNADRKKAWLSGCMAIIFGIFLLGLLSSCATTKPADFIAPGFNAVNVESVHVLPIIDHRIDQSKQLNLDEWVIPQAEKSLKNNGYLYEVHRDRSLISSITRDALETSNRDFITSLPPESARWVLLLVLEDSSAKLTFGSTGSAEMSGYLFDKKNCELCWRDKEVSQTGQGGLLGMAMVGVMERSAIEIAANHILLALPKRTK